MGPKTFALLCLKYSNHPRKVRLRSSQIVLKLRPSVLRVLPRIVSLSLSMLFLRGHFHSPFKMIAQKVEPSGSTGVYQPCFDRVQSQAVFFHPAANLL